MKDKQRPKQMTVIGLSDQVLSLESFDGFRLKNAVIPDSSRRQEVLQQGPKFTAERFLHGNAEPFFRTKYTSWRDMSGCEAF